MSKLDRDRLEEMRERYPADPCRQIAAYVLENPDLPDEDRLCAAGILGALDGASHDAYLTVIPVDGLTLMSAANAEAERLWRKYGEDGEYTQRRFPPTAPDLEEPADDGTRGRFRFRSLLHSSADVLKRASSLPRSQDEKHHFFSRAQQR